MPALLRTGRAWTGACTNVRPSRLAQAQRHAPYSEQQSIHARQSVAQGIHTHRHHLRSVDRVYLPPGSPLQGVIAAGLPLGLRLGLGSGLGLGDGYFPATTPPR